MTTSQVPVPPPAAIAAFLAALAERLPALTPVTDPDAAVGYAGDHALFSAVGVPAAVVFPTTTEEVAELCRTASEHRIPIVPRGAGTGLSGGANAVDGCLVISLQRMDRIVQIDPADAVAVVQPGVLNGELSRTVAAQGLFYPPDPSSQEISSIGGNVATNAGGLCCVKYGVTRDYVVGVQVVLADGRTTRLGRRTRKGVAGLDLTALFVGAEGTLGIVTEITVRLLRATDPGRSTMVAEMPSLESAGRAVAAIMSGTVPSMLEVMDATTLAALRAWKGVEFTDGVAAVLVAQSDAPDAAVRARDVAAMEQAALAAGAESAFTTDDAAEGDDLVAIRRMAGPALEQLGTVLVDDVAVPLSRLAEFLAGVGATAERLGARVAVIGHAGDGNMHPSIVFDPTDQDAARTAHRAFEEIAALGLALGGTITGEHGVGLLKATLLETELDEVAVDLHRAVKRALDPLGLMNPGKVLAPSTTTTHEE